LRLKFNYVPDSLSESPIEGYRVGLSESPIKVRLEDIRLITEPTSRDEDASFQTFSAAEQGALAMKKAEKNPPPQEFYPTTTYLDNKSSRAGATNPSAPRWIYGHER